MEVHVAGRGGTPAFLSQGRVRVVQGAAKVGAKNGREGRCQHRLVQKHREWRKGESSCPMKENVKSAVVYVQ